VSAVEEAGADIITTWDHFYPCSANRTQSTFECWTCRRPGQRPTSRVEDRALVTCNGYRNPELLADRPGTVDHISGAGFFLGIGAGWFERGYQSTATRLRHRGTRLGDLEAALPRITARWERLNPPPTRRIPILIGGGGGAPDPAPDARTPTSGTAASGIRPRSRTSTPVLDEWCAKEGRDRPRSSAHRRGRRPRDRARRCWPSHQLITVRAGGPRLRGPSVAAHGADRDGAQDELPRTPPAPTCRHAPGHRRA